MSDSASQNTNDFVAPTTAPPGAPGLYLVIVDVPPQFCAIDSEFKDIDDLAAADERNDVRRPFIEDARRKIAQALPREASGIAILRLRKGWSQRRLAEELGTSQPHIARVEGGQDIMLDTASRLARALGVTLDDIDAAMRARKSE
jgi:ribosome-binding protein aMBF1 (putative translation factor)